MHLRLTNDDRDAVAELLKDAFGEGQLDYEEFQHRLDLAMQAKTRKEIEPLLSDLAVRGGRPSAHPAFPHAEGQPTSAERLWSAGGHVSGYFLLALGPLVVLLANSRSSYVRRQATEALNYQLMILLASLLVVPIGIITLGVGFIVYVILMLGWLFLPALATLVSLGGGKWRYPLTYRLIKTGDGD